ncbi:MAG: hypothetical protein AAF228_13285 [Pseudomonadota bacterium]
MTANNRALCIALFFLSVFGAIYSLYGLTINIMTYGFDKKVSAINIGKQQFVKEYQKYSQKAEYIDDAIHLNNIKQRALHHQYILKNQITLSLFNYDILSRFGKNASAQHNLEMAISHIRSYLRKSPASSNYWFLLTQSLFVLDKKKELDASALQLSYLTAPREGWIARRRLGFAFQNILLLPPEFRKFMMQEFKSLGWVYRDDAVRIVIAAPEEFSSHFQKSFSYESLPVFNYVQRTIDQKSRL